MRRLCWLLALTACAPLWAAEPFSLFDPTVTVSWQEVPLSAAVAELSTKSGLDVSLPAAEPGPTVPAPNPAATGPKVTLAAKDQPLSQVLASLAKAVNGTLVYHGLQHRWRLTPAAAAPTDGRPTGECPPFLIKLDRLKLVRYLAQTFRQGDPQRNVSMSVELQVVGPTPAQALGLLALDGSVTAVADGNRLPARSLAPLPVLKPGEKRPPLPPFWSTSDGEGRFTVAFDVPAQMPTRLGLKGALMCYPGIVERAAAIETLDKPSKLPVTVGGIDFALVKITPGPEGTSYSLSIKRNLGPAANKQVDYMLRGNNAGRLVITPPQTVDFRPATPLPLLTIADKPVMLDPNTVARWFCPVICAETDKGRLPLDGKLLRRRLLREAKSLTLYCTVTVPKASGELRKLLVAALEPGEELATVPFAVAAVPLTGTPPVTAAAAD